jgi:hypothetical protein
VIEVILSFEACVGTNFFRYNIKNISFQRVFDFPWADVKIPFVGSLINILSKEYEKTIVGFKKSDIKVVKGK